MIHKMVVISEVVVKVGINVYLVCEKRTNIIKEPKREYKTKY